jgi:hypothetical protein
MVNDFYYTSLLKGVYQSIISKHAFKKVIYFRSSFINLQGIYRIVVFTTTGKTPRLLLQITIFWEAVYFHVYSPY